MTDSVALKWSKGRFFLAKIDDTATSNKSKILYRCMLIKKGIMYIGHNCNCGGASFFTRSFKWYSGCLHSANVLNALSKDCSSKLTIYPCVIYLNFYVEFWLVARLVELNQPTLSVTQSLSGVVVRKSVNVM